MDASRLPTDWDTALAPVKPELNRALDYVVAERAVGQVFPPAHELFTAFHLTSFQNVRVLILGQDPYHAERQAHGLSFSVKPGVKPPPSLVNIFKELETDLGHARPADGCLEPWARRGVLLLNALLSVRAGEAGSHQKIGWEGFTDGVLRALSLRKAPMVFLLWGNFARKKAPLVASHHVVIEGAHPSPLSARKFLGSRPFSSANDALVRLGQPPIDWRLGSGTGQP